MWRFSLSRGFWSSVHVIVARLRNPKPRGSGESVKARESQCFYWLARYISKKRKHVADTCSFFALDFLFFRAIFKLVVKLCLK